jgi:acetolactate synthase I/III small subunit
MNRVSADVSLLATGPLRPAPEQDIIMVSLEFESFSLMRHVLSATVQNVPGVLAHVAGMFASRGFNIDSLAVGETDDPRLSRMTFVVVGDDRVLEQVRKQLEKIVTVVRVDDVSSRDHVERDLMLIKVKVKPGQRSEIRELAEIFRGRVVDVAPEEVTIEIAGKEKKIEAFIDLMRPFGIIELVRTGRIAIVRTIDRKRQEEGGLRKYAASEET